MNTKRILGLSLILASGILGWANFVFTGAVIGISFLASLIPVILFIAGLVLILAETLEEKTKIKAVQSYISAPRHAMNSSQKYYHDRAEELMNSNGQAWISQSEIEGVKTELEKAGWKIRGPEIDYPGEHGISLRHLKAEGFNPNAVYKRLHLLITPDPYDPRLKKSGGLTSKKYKPEHD